MRPLKFKKGMCEGMARDIMAARGRILRRAEPEETYTLMRLADDLKSLGQMEHLETLANKFEAGRHYIGEHHDIEDPEVAQGIADEMAADLRKLKSHVLPTYEPITEERLRQAQQICGNYGVGLNLLERTAGSQDIRLN